MIRRADIEESNGNVAMDAWLPQASYPYGNFSDTSSLKFRKLKIDRHAFTVCIHTENQNQMSFSPFGPHEISVLIELILGHLCYRLTDVPPQPNSLPGPVLGLWVAGLTKNPTCKSRNQSIPLVYNRRIATPAAGTKGDTGPTSPSK